MQIIGFRWKLWRPVLILNNADGKESQIDLFSRDINLTVGELYCIGFKKNGKRYPCPGNRRIEKEWQCTQCAGMDEHTRCVRCTGSFCTNPEQRPVCMSNDYYIYLAAFGTLLKVGMTHEWRSLQRFVEQGADFAARVCHVKDGRIARKLEQHIKSTLNVADKISGEQKFSQLFEDPCISVGNINNALILLKRNNFNYIIEPEIEDLRIHYKLENVRMHPHKTEIMDGSRLKGRVVACKGNLIFIENDGGVQVINAHRLVGRHINNVT